MSRRSSIWAAVFLAVATLAVLFAVGRSRRPAPTPIAAPSTRTQLGAPPRPVQPAAVTQPEKPLPAWARVAVVAAAMLAFFVVSLVARRNA